MKFLFDIIFSELNNKFEEKKIEFILFTNLDIIYYLKLFSLLFNFYFINFLMIY